MNVFIVHRRRRARQRGSSLMVVFWLMAVLSFALFTSIQLISSDVSLVVSQKNDFRAMQLCEMGIAIAANPAVQRYDPILTQYDPVKQEGFSVRIRGEGGRLNINSLVTSEDSTLLERIFTFWGMEIERAEELVHCLSDWVDADDNRGLLGAENEYYTEIGLPNYPFNRPFYDLEEVGLVKNIDYLNFVKPDWRRYFTLYSSGKLDLSEADAEMIEMVAEVSDIAAFDFVRKRAGVDEFEGSEDDYQFQALEEALGELGIDPADPRANRLTVNEGTVRIESVGKVGDYTKQLVLVLRNRESNPVILNREEIFQTQP